MRIAYFRAGESIATANEFGVAISRRRRRIDLSRKGDGRVPRVSLPKDRPADSSVHVLNWRRTWVSRLIAPPGRNLPPEITFPGIVLGLAESLLSLASSNTKTDNEYPADIIVSFPQRYLSRFYVANLIFVRKCKFFGSLSLSLVAPKMS